jgi:hypothetical protein
MSERQMSIADFGGVTFDRDRDHPRLSNQARAVWAALSDGQWHTLGTLHEATGYPEASISARIRDLRKPQFGGCEVEREYVKRGLWRYRLVK